MSTAPNRHPIILGLLSFENCTPLRNLFSKIWQQQGMKINEYKPITLRPSKNIFLLGTMIHLGELEAPLSISNHDLAIVEQLIEIAKDQETSRSQTRHGIYPSSALQFFPAEHLETPLSSQYQIRFNDIKSEIKDPILKEDLFFSTILEAGYVEAINFHAIADFVIEYGINSENKEAPPSSALLDLITIISDHEILEAIINELESYKLFIDLDNLDRLDHQLLIVNQTIEKLNNKLKTTSSKSSIDEPDLDYKWLKIQKNIYTGFYEMLMDNKMQVEEDETSIELENCSTLSC